MQHAAAVAADEIQARTDDAAVARRQADQLRSRFADIAGLEAEIASLRVIAARVPDLQRRIAEYETAGEVVDLREGRAQS